MRNEVVEQILDKLLAEREKSQKLESSLSEARGILFRVRDLVCGETEDTLPEDLAHYVNEAERTKREYEALKGKQIEAVELSVTRALMSAGMLPSGDLKLDAENLARYFDSRLNNTGIL
jgi:hypothetical protein